LTYTVICAVEAHKACSRRSWNTSWCS